METIVKLSGVSKRYGAGAASVTALENIDMEIRAGEFVSLVGPSGSGKSTLLNLIGGIDQPSAGAVEVDGLRVDGLREQQLLALRREKLAYVFQEARLLPSLTALENVMLPSAFHGVLRKDGAQWARELMRRVGLADRADHMPHQLSGGEAQRVCIARALFSRPKLVLADEPTGNLDHKTRIEIVELFEVLHRGGNAVIMVTHDPELADRAERRITLHDGRIEGNQPRAFH
jgi:putative ABC transport system ATP-binding protein